MENSKTCIRCNKEKPLSGYYSHPMMRDGHLNVCKECCKNASRRRHKRMSKDEEWSENEKKRTKERYHRLNYNEKYKPLIPKERHTGHNMKARERYPEKYRAQILSQRLPITKGHHKHHWSYLDGFEKDIIVLSIRDHSKVHRYMIYDQERMLFRTCLETEIYITNELLDTRERHEIFINFILENKD